MLVAEPGQEWASLGFQPGFTSPDLGLRDSSFHPQLSLFLHAGTFRCGPGFLRDFYCG